MIRVRLAGLAAVLAMPAALAAAPRVEVAFTDPAGFSDLRSSRPPTGEELKELTAALRRAIEAEAERRLPEGAHLAITVTDVDLAGELRPSGRLGHREVRIVKETRPPRIALEFRLLGPDGAVLGEGRRELRDTMFLSAPAPEGRGVMAYEQAMIGRWLARELAAAR